MVDYQRDLDLDGAVMGVDDGFGDGHAEAGSAFLPVGDEGFEDAVSQIARDTWSRVGDAQQDGVALRFSRQPNRCTCFASQSNNSGCVGRPPM